MKILVSACLVGKKVKYNGGDNKIDHPIFDTHDLILCCPEVDGGLPTPRTPSEIVEDRVFSKDGFDVTKEFNKGANIALSLAKEHNIKIAILKSKSPSCSNNFIYDGTFSNRLVKKKGVTAKLLEENGIKVFNEHELDHIEEYIQKFKYLSK